VSAALAALMVAENSIAEGDDVSASQAQRFEIEGSWGRMDGPGGFAPVGFWRRTPDFRSGDRTRIDLTWWMVPHWSIKVGGGHATTRYETPVDPVCPISLAWLIGPPPFIGCPIGQPTPRMGDIEDRVRSADLGVGFRYPLGDALEVHAEIGYGWLRWRSRQDTEALAMADCIAIGRPGFADPVLRQDCTRVSGTSTRNGLMGELGLRWTLWRRLELDFKWAAKKYRYHLYRNEVVPRVFAANCPQPDLCGISATFLAVPIEDGSWSWLGARATWRFNERWAVFVNHEDGGSRPWQTTDVGLRLRF